MLKNKTLGAYTPSFFCIRLNTEKELIEAINGSEDWTVFVHEYLHFLQDIIFPFNIKRCRDLTTVFGIIIKKIKEDGFLSRPWKYDDECTETLNVLNESFGKGKHIISSSEGSRDINSVKEIIYIAERPSEIKNGPHGKSISVCYLPSGDFSAGIDTSIRIHFLHEDPF